MPAPSNLPAELDAFIGRHRALAEARRLTERARLVTLTGPGGVGKTRLAMRLATHATHSPSAYPDGVWLLSLGELTDAAQLADALTNVLALPAQQHTAHPHDLDVVLATLRAQRMLLVIDNCEHLVSAVAAAVRCVLSAAPGIRVLATSRIPLQLPGEHLMPVPPLSLEHGQDPSEAVQLLREQARAVNAELGEDDLDDAERLCRRLDGIPLAITLAAARLPSVGVKDLADSVTDGGRCPLLDTGEHYGQPWHRSLASAHDWSYSLCSREEQLVWERLSVFEGSFESPSAERIFADAGLTTALLRRLLVRLVDQSVLLADITGGTSRYRMLDSVRACGALRLSERDPSEQQRLQQAHAEYYLDLARQGTDEIGRRREIDWVRRLQLEAPNLLAAAEYLLAAGQPNQALDLAVELARTRWAFVTGQLDRTRDLLRRTLDAQHTVHPLQVAARVLAACIDLHQGRDAQAEAELTAADACTRTLGEQPALRSWVLLGRGLQLLARRDPTSLTVLQQAHDLWRQHAAPHSPYPGRGVRMWAAALLGDAITARQELDAPRSEPDASVLEDAWNQWCRGVTELRYGSPHLAAELLTGSACRQLQLGDRWGSAWSVEARAWAAAACRHDEQAAVLLGAAHHRLPTTNAVMGMGPAADLHEQWATTTRARLAEAFDDAFTHGTTLDDAALLAYLRELPDPAQHSEKPPGGLTDREYEIASLIAAGLTNKQIAEKLFVSIRTVDTHAESIRTKLGIFGTGARLKIARWWGQQQP